MLKFFKRKEVNAMKEFMAKFNIKDFLLPIMPTLILLILFIYIFFTDNAFIGKVIVGITSFAFMLFSFYWFWFKYYKLRPDFFLKNGGCVIGYENSNVTKNELELINSHILIFFSGQNVFGHILTSMYIRKAIYDIKIYFSKNEKIQLFERKVAGFYLNNSIVIKKTNKADQLSIYAHEVGHAILVNFSAIEKEHHAELELIGYGPKIKKAITKICSGQHPMENMATMESPVNSRKN